MIQKNLNYEKNKTNTNKSNERFILSDAADLDWTYEKTTSGRNYRNRWRGCVCVFLGREKKTLVQIFFVALAKSRVRENVTTRFAITLWPRELAFVLETLAFNTQLENFEAHFAKAQSSAQKNLPKFRLKQYINIWKYFHSGNTRIFEKMRVV